MLSAVFACRWLRSSVAFGALPIPSLGSSLARQPWHSAVVQLSGPQPLQSSIGLVPGRSVLRPLMSSNVLVLGRSILGCSVACCRSGARIGPVPALGPTICRSLWSSIILLGRFCARSLCTWPLTLIRRLATPGLTLTGPRPIQASPLSSARRSSAQRSHALRRLAAHALSSALSSDWPPRRSATLVPGALQRTLLGRFSEATSVLGRFAAQLLFWRSAALSHFVALGGLWRLTALALGQSRALECSPSPAFSTLPPSTASSALIVAMLACLLLLVCIACFSTLPACLLAGNRVLQSWDASILGACSCAHSGRRCSRSSTLGPTAWRSVLPSD